MNGGDTWADTDGGSDSPTFAEGSNYVDLEVTSNGSGVITLDYSSLNPYEGDLNGIQLESATPEPGTAYLAVLALAGAFFLRRRYAGGRLNAAKARSNFPRAKPGSIIRCTLVETFDRSREIDRAPEICRLSAVEMATLIRAGELSARETLEAHLNRIERVNPKVNAIVTLACDQAWAAAKRADELHAGGQSRGPLHGLPIAHKDLQLTRGIRTTFGSRIFRDFIPDENSPLVERIQGAGAITIGKTNTPEFGAGSQTFNEVFGATLNPWDLTKTCGGSSGGGAVSLACFMLPIADGTDVGASLRNPAAFCNVVGFRPSAGRVPSNSPTPFNVEGPMARSVADVAFFFSAIADSPLPPRRDLRGARIAWWKDLGGVPFDPEIREIVNAQLKVFESLGCIVEEAEPDFSGADEVFRTLRFRSTAERLGGFAAQHPELVKDTIRWEIEQSRGLTEADIARANEKYRELQRRMQAFMQRYDFFVMPVSQVPPFDVKQPWPAEVNGVRMETYIDWFKSCYYISVTGSPAISVPCGFTAEGLPVGLQISGRNQDDWGVLGMAQAYSEASSDARKT